MADCEKLNSRDPDFPILTAENVHEIILSTSDRSSGSEVTVYCADGYELVGESTFSCRDGVWSYGSKPYCIVAGTKQEDNNTSNILLIVTIVVVVVIVLILAIMIFVFCFRHYCKRKIKTQSDVREMQTIQNVQQHPVPGPYVQSPGLGSYSGDYAYTPSIVPHDQETKFSEDVTHSYSPYEGSHVSYGPRGGFYMQTSRYSLPRMLPYSTDSYAWQYGYDGKYPY